MLKYETKRILINKTVTPFTIKLNKVVLSSVKLMYSVLLLSVLKFFANKYFAAHTNNKHTVSMISTISLPSVFFPIEIKSSVFIIFSKIQNTNNLITIFMPTKLYLCRTN